MITREIEIIIEKEERQRHLSELQTRMQEEGIIPQPPFLLVHTLRRLLEYIGGACLASIVGTFVLVINFIVFVWLLHLEF